MKRIALLLLFVAGFASSCKKTGGDIIAPVDPRDRMLGSYAIGFNMRITISNIELQPESSTGSVTLSKAPNAGELYFDFELPNGKERVTAALKDDTNYTIIDKKTEPIYINGQSFVGQYTGSGQITAKNEFILTGVSEYTQIKKVTTMTGTKK
ncbi:hypothetical protein J2I47_21620 [Fibrella sp. HMF5335]|uniref:Lipocalin-like domain-containing protein n=1 Tax=Fibrella rubiginis TaxID=2817060 RepID=A0A939GHJ8_9BACT|nr:hypothetical protein [Fibrella rubiginis]MBO0939169.1 hypothetical protein [Fibrella rubiginis]